LEELHWSIKLITDFFDEFEDRLCDKRPQNISLNDAAMQSLREYSDLTTDDWDDFEIMKALRNYLLIEVNKKLQVTNG
jgi:hypothetical protein